MYQSVLRSEYLYKPNLHHIDAVAYAKLKCPDSGWVTNLALIKRNNTNKKEHIFFFFNKEEHTYCPEIIDSKFRTRWGGW